MPYPTDITADRAQGTLSIQWDDGHQSAYPVGLLRWRCPCASCAGEWGQPGLLSALRVLPADDLKLTDVQAVGSYGITPVWASGHNTGIYTFEYLRSLCPCSDCRPQQST